MLKLFEELTPPNRIKIEVGDLFTYRIHGEYRFMRVAADHVLGRDRTSILLYFYRPSTGSPEQIPLLRKEDLLLPPMLTLHASLRFGHTPRVSSLPLAPGDRFNRHCFELSKTIPMFVDETGAPVAGRFEPCSSDHGKFPVGIEIEVAKSLGIIRDGKDWGELHYQPRPLYRASMAGKLPHSTVDLVLPDWDEKVAPMLLSRQEHEGKKPEISYARQADDYLWFWLNRHGGFREVATHHEFGGNWTIKRRQHARFYELMAKAMAELGVERWWIVDPFLNDWLAGTYKPPDLRPL